MLNLVSNLVTWAPSVYYASGIANTLITPSYMISKSPPTNLAKDIFSRLDEAKTLRKNIHIYHMPIPYARALGTNFGPGATIYYNPDLESVDRDAWSFICKHELSHIHSSDGFFASSLAVLASAVSTFVIPYLESILPWWAAPIAYAVPLWVGLNVYNTCMLIAELRADSFAAKLATDEELMGIHRFLTAQIDVNKELHKKYPQIFNADGDTRFGQELTHGSCTERLDEFTLECANRKIFIPQHEEAQMEKLRQFHRETYKKFYKLSIE